MSNIPLEQPNSNSEPKTSWLKKLRKKFTLYKKTREFREWLDNKIKTEPNCPLCGKKLKIWWKDMRTTKIEDRVFYLLDGDLADFYAVDHVKPLSRGGINHISNLTLLCSKCNGKKGNKE